MWKYLRICRDALTFDAACSARVRAAGPLFYSLQGLVQIEQGFKVIQNPFQMGLQKLNGTVSSGSFLCKSSPQTLTFMLLENDGMLEIEIV